MKKIQHLEEKQVDQVKSLTRRLSLIHDNNLYAVSETLGVKIAINEELQKSSKFHQPSKRSWGQFKHTTHTDKNWGPLFWEPY